MPANIEKQLGAQLAKIRKERGLTQSELAELIDVTIETISRLERGVSVPSLKTLENISNVLNVPLKNIFDFEYPQKSRVSAIEKESIKLLSYLKTRRVDDIKMCCRILKSIFEQIEKNYQMKKK
ncbi:MAG: helix-turn-helix transcriptional regulator [Nitrospirota bacterium]